MAFDRYHYAAKDGFIEVLRDCNKKEANSRDENGMTPVLWASFEGRLEALRLLVGKGGDPDRSDAFGNTALHLAAARGHFSCVDFLTKFGCNLFSVDIDNHTAKDLAAINNRDEILRYLDAATAQLEAIDRKKARTMKDSAKKTAEKRAKEFSKKHKNGEPLKMINQNRNVLQTWKQKLWAGSQGNLKTINDIAEANKRYSSLVGGTLAGKTGTQKFLNGRPELNDDFKVGEIEPNGKRSVRSIQGVRRDSEILYVGTYETVENRRGKISEVFKHTSSSEDCEEEAHPRHATLSRSISQPDFLVNSLNGSQNGDEEGSNSTGDNLPRRNGAPFLNRPLTGALAIPRATTAVLSHVENSDRSSSTESSSTNYRNSALIKAKPRQFPMLSETDSEDDGSNLEHDGRSSIERFLIAWGLGDFVKLFEEQQIDLDTLMLLTENDLRSLNLPLGPFRKLCVAIQERKSAFQKPGIITDIRF